MTKIDATPEELALFDSPGGFRAQVSANAWPFSGRRIERITIASLVLSGGAIFDTEFAVESFEKPVWRDLEFRDCVFGVGSFDDPTFERVRFENCTFELGGISGGRLADVKFTRCNLTGTLVERTRFEGVTLEDCTVSKTILDTGCSFERIVMRGTTLRGISAFEVVLAGLVLEGGTIERARLGSGGRWEDLTFTNVAIREVEVTDSEVMRVRVTGGALDNFGMVEGILEDIELDSLTSVFAVGIGRASITRMLFKNLLSVMRLHVHDCVLRAMQFATVRVFGLELTGSTAEGTLLFADVDAKQVTLSKANIEGWTCNGGSFDGTIPVDEANINNWILEGTALGAQFKLLGRDAQIESSDVRLRVTE